MLRCISLEQLVNTRLPVFEAAIGAVPVRHDLGVLSLAEHLHISHCLVRIHGDAFQQALKVTQHT